MSWAYFSADLLWRNAWAVIPLAVIVAFACRCVRIRPATRYMLWLIVLLGFVVPLALPELPALPALERMTRPTEPAIAELTPPESYIRPSYDSWGPRVWGDSATSPQADARIEPRVPHKLPPAPGSAGPLCERESPGAVEVEAVSAMPLLAFEHGVSDWATGGRQPALDGPSPGLAPRSIGTTSTDIPGSEGIDSGAGLDEESMVIKPHSGWWRPWLVGLLAVRDAIGRLPALPPSIWAAGFVLLLLYQLARVIRFQRRLRAAFPAPAAVVRTVAEAARSFGLSRVPETSMLAECVSPMIWCGRRSRLILPAHLWSEFDSRGRQAIVYHELAHLRRRDHWVCWLEMLIAALYWWHPVVWWARRRLREEADLCCDAWVTWLMPKRRRAYAEALLRTKQFVSDGRAAVPAGGISMTSMGARQLARRLTMVMTGSARPAASLSGIALAVGVAVVGWLTLPAWACPPKADKPACDEKEASACAVPKAAEVLICDGEGSSFETYLLRGGEVELADPQRIRVLATSVATGLSLSPSGVLLAASDEDEELDQKLERLERELEQLTRQLAELRALSHIERGVLTVLTRPTPPMPPMPPTPPVPPTPPMPPMGYVPHVAPMPPVQYEQEIVVQSYQLPEGKLEALTALMVRDDVPVLVRPLDDRIEVHATARQHKVFQAFVELIHPPKECKEKAGTPHETSRVRPFGYSVKTSGAGPFGYSAPGAAKTYEDALKTHSETLTRLYDAFGRAQASDEAQRAYKDAAKALRDAFRTQGRAAEDTHAAALDALSKYTRREAHARTAQAAAMKARAAAFARQAEQLGAQAEALVERATELARAAEDVTDAAKAKALSEEVRALEKQARELERQARQLERRSQAIERESRQAQDAAGELDDSADELEETLRVLEKHAECKGDE